MRLAELQQLCEAKQVSTMWRNANDTIRARIFDRRDIGAEVPKGHQFDIDIFIKGGHMRSGVMSDAGDIFFSREEARDWLLKEYPDMKPFRLPREADTYTHGWA